jgi:hypothetical protein
MFWCRCFWAIRPVYPLAAELNRVSLISVRWHWLPSFLQRLQLFGFRTDAANSGTGMLPLCLM